MSETYEYKFHPSLTTPIKTGAKTVTFRYQDERTPTPGDEICATTPNGDAFAWLEVQTVESGPAAHAYEWVRLIGGQYGADSSSEIIDRLNEHYDDEITRESIIQGIHFERVDGGSDA